MKRTTKQVSILLALLIAGGCGSAPHDIVSTVPIGSKLSELDHLIHRGSGSRGEVMGYSPKVAPEHWVSGILDKPKGAIDREPIDYDRWTASPEERDRFTGKITFTDQGSTSTDVNEFTYVNGRLVDKDWGFLAG